MFHSDKPITSNNEDQLNRKGFAKLLAHSLAHLDSEDTFTVGLFGKWGCGILIQQFNHMPRITISITSAMSKNLNLY